MVIVPYATSIFVLARLSLFRLGRSVVNWLKAGTHYPVRRQDFGIVAVALLTGLLGSSAAAQAQTATTTTLTSSPNPSTYGQGVTVTATVSSPGGTPNGSVRFGPFTVVGCISICERYVDVELVAGVASLTSWPLPPGVSYLGNANFGPSYSGLVGHTINPIVTTTSLTSSPNPSRLGQSVTLTATVNAQHGWGSVEECNGGWIYFRDGATLLHFESLGLANGQASFATTTLGVTSHSITAEYISDCPGKIASSVSNIVYQSVGKADSVTTLSVSPSPAQAGQTVMLTAVVAPIPSGSGTPSGSVVFRNGTAVLGTELVSGGAARFSTSSFAIGGHSLSATYQGDDSFLASLSPATLTVNRSCNDALSGATAIPGPSGAASGSTSAATGEIGEPNHAGATGLINSVWCQWTAPATGPVTFDTTGSLFDTTLAVYTGSIVSMLTQVAANDNIAPTTVQSRVTFTAQQGTVYKIAVDGAGNAKGTYALTWIQAPAAPSLFASVLPTSRSILTGSTATAFATMVNGGSTALTQCKIALPPGFPATFSYQAATPANVPTGQANTPVDVPMGGAQSFIFGITPTTNLNGAEIGLVFSCTNSQPAPSVLGLNTLMLSASATPTPDILAIVSTVSNDGIVNVPLSGTGLFAAAAVNIGEAGNITVSVDDGGHGLPLVVSLCRSNPTTGACATSAQPAAMDKPTMATNEVITFTVFVQATAPVAFNPGVNRLQLRLKTDDGVTRGSTSVAVRTQ